jgi:hypothetical protein
VRSSAWAGSGHRVFNMGQPSFIGLTIVFDMPKATPDAHDQSGQIARMERLCSALDDVREESERLYHEITTEARRASAAAKKGEHARGVVMRTVEPGCQPAAELRLPRDRAD